jgi:hypothetical protein
MALCAALLVGFAILRVLRSPPVPGVRQRRYLILPRTTPTAAALDPHSPEP